MPPVRQLPDLTSHVQLATQVRFFLFHPLIVETQSSPDKGMRMPQELSCHPLRQRQGQQADVGLARLVTGHIQHFGQHTHQLRTAGRRVIHLRVRLGQYLQLQPAGRAQDTHETFPLQGLPCPQGGHILFLLAKTAEPVKGRGRDLGPVQRRDGDRSGGQPAVFTNSDEAHAFCPSSFSFCIRKLP